MAKQGANIAGHWAGQQALSNSRFAFFSTAWDSESVPLAVLIRQRHHMFSLPRPVKCVDVYSPS
jgi:hypothetical protein